MFHAVLLTFRISGRLNGGLCQVVNDDGYSHYRVAVGVKKEESPQLSIRIDLLTDPRNIT